ncbi:hypothetical protein Drorol1_Dr00013074 [Drosera rotundifolia]
MGSSCSDDDENQFFDAIEEIAVTSDSGSIGSNGTMTDLDSSTGCSVSRICQFDMWMQSPESIQERRSKFLDWFDSSVNTASGIKGSDGLDSNEVFHGITRCSGAALRSSRFGIDGLLRQRSAACSSSFLDSICGLQNSDAEALPGGAELADVDPVDEHEEAGSRGCTMTDPLDQSTGSELSPRVAGALNSKSLDSGNRASPRKRLKKQWLKRFRSFSCVMDGQSIAVDSDPVLPRDRIQRVKVSHSWKKSKELSALYLGQDIPAHKGAILTMKFSLDGQYLASAGEDGIVRLWQVVEDDRLNDLDIPDVDPSCLYFTMNHLSELKTIGSQKEKRSLRKTTDSACVVIPPNVFRLLEKPIHEFRGHTGEILDLSWSKNNQLLSSSVDNTVRLWQVGCNDCLKVFSNNNYVTCAQFNPVDENYFISGSIDGKIRIWDISGCQVVNWADIKDIVTAVCYRPDGKGVIVGTLTGCCRLYNVSGNNLQLDSQICLQSKKKKSCKRITAFQYIPQDFNKVMVTCADSRITILDGMNVIGKYKGPRNGANYLSASFTSDGKRIVSACEDSNVYVWNCVDHDTQDPSQVRKISSSERFPTNASVAIPWHGMQNMNIRNKWQFHSFDERMLNSLPFSPRSFFSRSQDFFLETYPKGTATWPEEKLLDCNEVARTASMGRAEYKFLKNSFLTTSSSHAWGLVIVTASWDGRIRSFVNYGLPVP